MMPKSKEKRARILSLIVTQHRISTCPVAQVIPVMNFCLSVLEKYPNLGKKTILVSLLTHISHPNILKQKIVLIVMSHKLSVITTKYNIRKLHNLYRLILFLDLFMTVDWPNHGRLILGEVILKTACGEVIAELFLLHLIADYAATVPTHADLALRRISKWKEQTSKTIGCDCPKPSKPEKKKKTEKENVNPRGRKRIKDCLLWYCVIVCCVKRIKCLPPSYLQTCTSTPGCLSNC